MSVPANFTDTEEYLLEALYFLKTHQWLYNFHNTHILAFNVFESMPREWIEYFKNGSKTDLDDIVLCNIKQASVVPNSLRIYVETVKRLKANNEIYESNLFNNRTQISHNSGLSPKKMHEILHLAPLVHNICKEADCEIIIDIGSGLGYLSHLLNTQYNYKVLGIECCESYIRQAYKLQEKFYPNTKNLVKFANHLIDEHSSDTIQSLLQTHFENVINKNVCITGLHACADLSITVLDLFSKMDNVKALVVMPCCYHRMSIEVETDKCETFKKFPSSNLYKQLFKNIDASKFLRRPLLRLACQQISESFLKMTSTDLQTQTKNCIYRVILQAVAEEENQHVRRLKRKSGLSQTRTPDSPDADFEHYLHNLPHTHQLVSKIRKSDGAWTTCSHQHSNLDKTTFNQLTAGGDQDNLPNVTDLRNLKINDSAFIRKMREKWKKYKGDRGLFEALTALQFSIQSVCENVVLLDRVEFLSEKGYECYIKRVLDGVVSPRCHALVAVKQ